MQQPNRFLQRTASVFGLGLAFLLVVSIFPLCDGGSPCPARESIYPCMCTSIPLQGTNIFTMITCRHIADTNSLAVIYPSLIHMIIDRFILIDAFLDVEKDSQQRLPQDWLALLRMHELEIIDSLLSPSFICDMTMDCSKAFQTHFTVRNSSKTESVTTVCERSDKARVPWTDCMKRLKYFRFIHNNLQAIENDFFPYPMTNLLELNFTSNKIRKLGSGAFQNLPKLTALDLSNNLITDLSENIFGGEMNLKILDLSFNHITTIPSDFFLGLPYLVTLNLQHNLLTTLQKETWQQMDKAIRILDFTENPFHCNCKMKWINLVFPSHTAISGSCLTPEEQRLKTLRKVATLLNKRCNETVNEDDDDDFDRNVMNDRGFVA